MKKLDPSSISMSQKAINVVKDENGSLLYFGEGFAYVPKGMKRPTFAFKSEFCENLLDSIKDELINVQILTIVPEEMCEHLEADFEIRFVLKSGVIFMLNSENEAFRMHPLNDEPHEDPDMSEAHLVWGLPNESPYNQMLCSFAAIDKICQNFGEMEPSRALVQLWNDIRSTIEDAVFHDVHVALEVNSSVGHYEIVEHLCGRVAIYVRGEVPQRFIVF